MDESCNIITKNDKVNHNSSNVNVIKLLNENRQSFQTLILEDISKRDKNYMNANVELQKQLIQKNLLEIIKVSPKEVIERLNKELHL